MTMNKIWFILFCIIGLTKSIAQTSSSFINRNPSLQKITTPNVGSFNKFIDNPISLYYGRPDINIPLYVLKDGVIEFPISIRYNTSGIKVDEEASWIGLGWNLNLGGNITQNVLGAYDQVDKYYNDFMNDGLFTNISTNSYNYGYTKVPYSLEVHQKIKCALGGEEYCTRQLGKINPDVFYFSYPGGAGKFFIDPLNNNIYIFNREKNLKIEILSVDNSKSTYIRSFKITTPEGIAHFFENPYEFYTGGATNPQECSSVSYSLYKTIYPNGQMITYEYEILDYEKYVCNELLICPLYSQVGTYNQIYHNKYDNYFVTKHQGKELLLKSIVTTNYKINFITDSRIDVKNGKKLNEIIVEAIAKDVSTTTKIYKFLYSYFDTQDYSWENYWNINVWPIGSDYAKKRLKLNSVYEINQNTQTNRYDFVYDETKQLPRKDSYAVDYWGYYNSKTGNKSFIPDFNLLFWSSKKTSSIHNQIVNSNYISESYKANRGSSFNSTKAGILIGIEYPTGGYTKFTYESNSFNQIGAKYWDIQIPARPPFAPVVDPDYYIPSADELLENTRFIEVYDHNISGNPKSATFTVENNCKGTLIINFDKGTGKTWSTVLANYSVEILKKNTSGIYVGFYSGNIFSVISDYTSTQTKTVELDLSAGDYIMNVEFPNFSDNYAGGELRANLSFQTTIEKPKQSSGAGIRIKNISSYNSKDDITPLLSTNYEYNNPNETVSSGILHDPINFLNINGTYFSLFDPQYSPAKVSEKYVELLEISGNGILSNPYGSSSGVGYSFVKEIPQGQNVGYKLYRYYNHIGSYKQNGIKLELDNESLGSYPSLNGKLHELKTYNNSNILLVSEKNNFLSVKQHRSIGLNFIDNYNRSFDKFFANTNYTKNNNSVILVDGFYGSNTYYGDRTDIYLFEIIPYDLKLNSKEIQKDGVVLNENYNYNNSTLQLKSKIVTDGTGDELNYMYYYPNDFNCGIYIDMANKNMYSSIIEQKILKNNLLVGGTLTRYNQFGNNIAPETINYSEIKQGITNLTTFSCDGLNKSFYPNDNVKFNRYDGFSNCIYLTQNNSINIVYLWGNNGQNLIAEIKNATYDEVKNALGGIAPEDFSIMKNPDMARINALRSNSILSNAHITTYTYMPFLGITSITDPRGIITYYDYDLFNRLREVYKIENGVKQSINLFDYYLRNQ